MSGPVSEQGKAECTDPRCRRSGTGECWGYHCPKCGEPCGMMGHETCPPATATGPQAANAAPKEGSK